jgi:hypothetical protein
MHVSYVPNYISWAAYVKPCSPLPYSTSEPFFSEKSALQFQNLFLLFVVATYFQPSRFSDSTRTAFRTQFMSGRRQKDNCIRALQGPVFGIS